MYRIVSTGLALLLLGSALGCAPMDRQKALERELAEMKSRLEQMETSTRGMGEAFATGTEDRLAELGRLTAETRAGLNGLRVDMQSISGRMEDGMAANRQFQEDVSLMREDVGLKVTAIEDRLSVLESREAPAAEVTAPNWAGKPETSARPAETPAVQPEEIYQQGLDLIREKNRFAQGREVLQRFIEQHPDHQLAVNASYWIGETYYGEKKYDNAILQFQQLIQAHPGHAKVPDALLKQGLAFYSLGDTQNATVILQKVVDDHPRSAAAGKAKERLQAWKKQ